MEQSFSHQQLNQFAQAQWEKTMAFLKSQFSLSHSDCEDVFQESFIVLYQHTVDGRLANMTASLATSQQGTRIAAWTWQRTEYH